MILGLITMVSVFVTRFPKAGPHEIILPEYLSLPADITPSAVTFGAGWVAIVDGGQRIIVFDSATMAEIGRLDIGAR